MRNTKNWKHIKKQPKQYGSRKGTKYETPFMVLDERYLIKEDTEDDQ